MWKFHLENWEGQIFEQFRWVDWNRRSHIVRDVTFPQKNQHDTRKKKQFEDVYTSYLNIKNMMFFSCLPVLVWKPESSSRNLTHPPQSPGGCVNVIFNKPCYVELPSTIRPSPPWFRPTANLRWGGGWEKVQRLLGPCCFWGGLFVGGGCSTMFLLASFEGNTLPSL